MGNIYTVGPNEALIVSGSAGSVVATRLSEISRWKILLLEAGGDPTFESDIPGFGLSLPGRTLDWKFLTNKSGNACLGMEEESCAVFQGRVLGGTSTINKMHYIRGNAEDYNEWEKLGNKDWRYEEVLEYFKKSEKLDEDFSMMKANTYEEDFIKLKEAATGDDKKLHEVFKKVPGKYHSKAGLMSVNHYSYDVTLPRLKKRVFAAAEEMGVPYVADINGKFQIGFVRAMGAIHEGNRGNTAKAFLTPFKDRNNLFVVKNATVQMLIIEGGKVKGVSFIRNGETKMVRVKNEVILSAGAVNSPKILLLSGVGSRKHLETLGINVVKDLPGVGKNLQLPISFFGLPFIVDKDKSKPITHLEKIDAMYQFISRGTGLFGSIGMNDVLGFIATEKDSSIPDVQFSHYLNHIRDYYTLNELLISLKIKNEIRDQFAKAYSTSNVLLICPTLLKPKSRGRVELANTDFNYPPKIIANFFDDNNDMDTLLKGISFGIRLTETKAFRELQPKLLKLEIDDCEKFEFKTDDYWKCLIRHMSTSMHDAAGTCKMGPIEDPLAVVDDKLRVYGVKGLRVADSSIMPTIIRGSTSISSVMIGEKVSDLIKNEWKPISHTEL